ncbi:MAG: 4-hydroxythreonine-4-phosphate dehydrogenase PdxA, partial [Acidobacteriota bacterium]
AALDALRSSVADGPWDRLRFFDRGQAERAIADPHFAAAGTVPVVDPSRVDPPSTDRTVVPGRPSVDDARGALAALDLGVDLVRIADATGDEAALVTAPLSKAEIAQHLHPDFRGHTDYLARNAGLERYGRDYLMAFLAPGLRVALLSTHLPLRDALDGVTEPRLLDALRCLARHAVTSATGRIAVAGVDPHAGEGGLLGTMDRDVVAPAITAAQAAGIDAHGPESADSVFARARRGAFDWVLALYHDQGLIAIKTATFGEATNWTVGLPYLRTSVDHGTAYDIAGQGVADPSSLRSVVATTVDLLGARRATRGGETVV